MAHDPIKADDVPVTRKMLDETTESLRSEIRALDRKMDSRFAQIDSKFAQIDSKFAQIDSKLELVLAAVHRNSAIIEEQNARNHYVLDAWAALHDAQQRQKHRLNHLEKRVFGIEQE